MISQLYADEKVFEILAYSIEEEGISIGIGDTLLVGGDIDSEKAIIMKPDLFYSSRNMKGNAPKSADGVVLVDDSGSFHLYVAELKSSRLPAIKKADIKAKFDTVFERFFIDDYAHVFNNQNMPYNLVSLNIWLVCDPLGLREKSVDDDEFIRRAGALKSKMRTLLADYAAGFKPYAFKGIVATVQPMLSPPTIEVGGFTDLLA